MPEANLLNRGRRIGFVLAAVVVGMLLGGLLSGGFRGSPNPNATSAIGPDVGDIRVGQANAGPTDKVEGVGVGFAPSEEGAVAAATNLILTLEQAGTAERVDAVRAYEILAADASRQTLASEMATSWDALHGGIIVNGPVNSSLFLRTVPVGHRLTRYTSERATVEIWTLTVVAAAGLGEPLASWETALVEMVWEDNDWKIWSAQSQPGPSPAWATANPTGIETFLAAVDTLEGYRYVSD